MIDQVTTFVTRRKPSSGGPLKVGGPGHVPSVPVGKDGPGTNTGRFKYNAILIKKHISVKLKIF